MDLRVVGFSELMGNWRFAFLIPYMLYNSQSLLTDSVFSSSTSVMGVYILQHLLSLWIHGYTEI